MRSGLGVSAHYCIEEDGTVHRLVREDRRAWHAGKSYWRGVTDINSASVGIELVNPGHEFGYRPFPDAQMEALLPLLDEIVQRWDVPRANVVGHSDIAPTRKEDPGELFDWDLLAAHRLALRSPRVTAPSPFENDGAFFLAFERWGYDISDDRRRRPAHSSAAGARTSSTAWSMGNVRRCCLRCCSTGIAARRGDAQIEPDPDVANMPRACQLRHRSTERWRHDQHSAGASEDHWRSHGGAALRGDALRRCGPRCCDWPHCCDDLR